MSVTAMLILVALVGMLGLAEIGYLFWAKRDAQKVADLAALAGAQALELCSPDNLDNGAARGNAFDDNRFAGDLRIECGHWRPDATVEERFVHGDPSLPLNAVKAVAARTVVPFFGMVQTLPRIQAVAVAILPDPQASFSVGSQLLRIDGQTPLGTTLKLVGADLDGTSVLGYDGLAQVKATPRGLLEALGIPVQADIGAGELDALLAGRTVSLGDLLDASAVLVSRSEAADIDLAALRNALAPAIDLNRLSIPLGSTPEQGGLFARIDAGQAAINGVLDAEVDVYGLLNTGIAIARGDNAVTVDGLDILGLVTAQARIIEPPSIAIGGPGVTAYNAQVRVFLDIDSNNIPAVSSLLGLLDVRLHLPIHLDLVNAMGTLQEIDCNADPPTATVRVQSSILRSCVGRVPPALRFSTQAVCDSQLQDEELLRLFGAPVVNGRFSLPALPDTQDITLAEGQSGSVRANPLAVGATVSELVEKLLGIMAQGVNPKNSDAPEQDTAQRLASRYIAATNPGSGRYNVDTIIQALRNGSSASGLEPLGQWEVKAAVPSPCGLLGLNTCWSDGSVWDSYRALVTGDGFGTLDVLLGGLLGGLVVNRCDSLLGNLNYNACVRNNLVSYLRTAPNGFLDPHADEGGLVDPTTDAVSCNGLLCLVLKPALALLKPLLNAVGRFLGETLEDVLGIQLGRTDVHMHSIQCKPVRLVQ
ncbi:TadG family pilus assembly protein [Pseudoxanthomonas broegbernensis]|nr:TadG family pilus assembly protein [Pseudoxanthomonas broegbernensis]MBB6064422.1 putative membrane protein [Pseudoxanthomonas broegbernensis]